MDSRYDGKPLLRLLECYVLWAIGELASEQQSLLEGMTPRLQTTYATQGKWQDVIAKAMGFPPNMPDLIRDMWARNQVTAQTQGLSLPPQQFAEIFVDRNLA